MDIASLVSTLIANPIAYRILSSVNIKSMISDNRSDSSYVAPTIHLTSNYLRISTVRTLSMINCSILNLLIASL